MKSVVLLATLVSMVQGQAPTPTLCERMAPQIGMKAVERGRQGQTTGEWRVNTLSGIGPALFWRDRGYLDLGSAPRRSQL